MQVKIHSEQFIPKLSDFCPSARNKRGQATFSINVIEILYRNRLADHRKELDKEIARKK
ncbi:MAG: hypothetical protein MAG551_02533 [Candidatus Scalindua arabica]|uniref:Uncharacterized protein n=1 Tax=Candidatus Scalindua arabica TaxID=1127984 RepID=A0A941W5Z7_9BACT|nr:hypothetical protein [Candidatus Scalindua arabica]